MEIVSVFITPSTEIPTLDEKFRNGMRYTSFTIDSKAELNEELFAEINRALAAPSVPDPDFF